LCFVVDAAFYVPEKLAELNNVHWITRVPAQLSEARKLLNKPREGLIWQTFDDNYSASAHETIIHGIKQRKQHWLLV
tara:strand:- start:202 stop:432 length:231 start_codon:yes stop_codon:yes gene_type:complete